MGDTSSTGSSSTGSSSTPPPQPLYSKWVNETLAELKLRKAAPQLGKAAPAPFDTDRQTQLRKAPKGSGKARTVWGKFAAESLFGSEDARNTISDVSKQRIKEQRDLGTAAEMEVTSTNGNKLHGNFFSAEGHNLKDKGKPDTSRPVVLFLSGSGGSAEDQGTNVAEFYQESGASVMALNYGGYGDPDDDNPPQPTEESLYQDGQAMLQHLLDLGYDPGQVIIHGYSMGGAVAGKLQAANEKTKGAPQFRGLALDRPMLSSSAGVHGHAEDLPGGKTMAPLAAFMTRKSCGKMSARNALKASKSTTPMVITSDQGDFAKPADALRDKLTKKGAVLASKNQPARQVEGTASGAGHFDHQAMLKKNGDYLKGLVEHQRDGTSDPPPDMGTTDLGKASSWKLRDKLQARIKEIGEELSKMDSDCDNSIKLCKRFTPIPQAIKGKATSDVQLALADAEICLDELTEMKLGTAGAAILNNQQFSGLNLSTKLDAHLKAAKALTLKLNRFSSDLGGTPTYRPAMVDGTLGQMKDAKAFLDGAFLAISKGSNAYRITGSSIWEKEALAADAAYQQLKADSVAFPIGEKQFLDDFEDAMDDLKQRQAAALQPPPTPKLDQSGSSSSSESSSGSVRRSRRKALSTLKDSVQ